MDQLDLWNLSGFLLPSVNVCLYSVEQSVQVTKTDLFVKMETDNFPLEWYCHRRNVFLNYQRQNIYSFIVSCNSDPGSPLVVERLQEGPYCFYKDGSDCLNGNWQFPSSGTSVGAAVAKTSATFSLLEFIHYCVLYQWRGKSSGCLYVVERVRYGFASCDNYRIMR